MQKLFGKKLILANPRGFCAGVQRAIDIVNRAVTLFGDPIYVKHEVVHNKYVIEKLKQKGVIFIEDIEGPIGIIQCSTDENCNLIDCCNIKGPINKINNNIKNILSKVKLKDIAF